MRGLSLILISFGLLTTVLAEDLSRTYYVQIIRGTDSDAAMPASYHAVGPKLGKCLSPVFRWKHYWEVSQHAVTVQPGKARRVCIAADRAVEVELIRPDTTEIRLYRDGKQVRKSRQSADEKISLMGWDDMGDESWFVAVRQEKPH